MKKVVLLIVVLGLLNGIALAQTAGTLERIPLLTLSGYYSVNEGEFQAKATLETNATVYANGIYYQTLHVAKNNSTGLSNVYLNGQPKWSLNIQVRPFLTTDAWKTGIFVVKYLDKDSPGIGYGMETVYARNVNQEICDSVVSVGDDGFVFKIGRKYYYTKFRGVSTVSQPVQIVWPEKMVYGNEGRYVYLPKEDASRLSKGDVYHFCYWDDRTVGHYYYVYRDEYMQYSVLVVDGKPFELFDVYSDDDIRMKYSFNGDHWMAVAGKYFWIDGQMKLVGEYNISDFFINDEGDYYYKAVKIGDEEKRETIVANGEIIRKDARVGYFNLNAMQKLTFHFFSGGQCFVYDDGVISNKTEEFMSSFYEPDRIDGMNVKIVSNNKHTLEYVMGRAGLFIDGKRIIETKPFQVFYDSKHNYFRWNCVESNSEGRTVLVLYKYHL